MLGCATVPGPSVSPAVCLADRSFDSIPTDDDPDMPQVNVDAITVAFSKVCDLSLSFSVSAYCSSANLPRAKGSGSGGSVAVT